MRFLFEEFSWSQLGLFFASWGTLMIAAAISFVAQLVYNRGRMTLRQTINVLFPIAGWSTRSARIDIIMHVVARLSVRLYLIAEPLVSMWIAFRLATLLSSLWPDYTPMPSTFTSTILGAVVVFLVSDLSSYGSHFLRHRVPFLWELHKVHHSATFLSPATAARIHPLEKAVDRLFITVSEGLPLGVFGFLFGLTEPQLLIMVASVRTISCAAVFEELKHSHFALSFRTFDSVFLSPSMHQVHHSGQRHHAGSNFGDKLSIWDRVFGTMYVPARDERWEFGLGTAETKDYETLHGVYVLPLVKMWRRLRRGGDRAPVAPRAPAFVQDEAAPARDRRDTLVPAGRNAA